MMMITVVFAAQLRKVQQLRPTSERPVSNHVGPGGEGADD
jgi:hypothetical protein